MLKKEDIHGILLKTRLNKKFCKRTFILKYFKGGMQ